MKENENSLINQLSGVKIKLVILLSMIVIIILLIGIFVPGLVKKISISIFLYILAIWVGTSLLKPLNNYKNSFKEEYKTLSRALSGLADSIEKITRSGFFESLPVENDDEIGHIAKSFNYLLENINNFARELDNISEEAFTTSRNLTDETNRTSTAMKHVNNTLQELTNTTQELSNSIIEIADGAKEVDELAQEGLGQLQDMEKHMSAIIDAAEKASERIKQLNHSSDKIKEILNVITNIAEQTNLLALNAAIEAARAGEYGRGFTVVADEIRQLAKNTQDSLQDISQIVNNLTQETTHTVEIINSNNKQVKEGEEILEKTSFRFQVIAKNIQGMVKKIDEAASASQQITAGSEEISAATEEQTTATEKIFHLAQNLSNMATTLKEILAETSIGGVKLELDLNEFDRKMNKVNLNQQEELKGKLNIKDKFIIGMIARLEAVKGHKFFFEGLKPVLKKYKDVVCIIIGDGSLKEELQDLVRKEGLQKRILFLGYRDDIHLLLSISDLVVLTSEKEGMPPNIIAEAMAAKKPVVVTDVTGNRYLVKDQVNGLLVQYNDVNALTESLEFFITTPEMCKQYGIKGRKRIETLV
jgi:methyl-accepting chemotaxis protein